MKWNSVDPAKIHRLFYPQVPIIVTVEFQDRVGGMPAIWCMPLSFSPVLVGVALAPEHETYRMIVDAQAFGLNWVQFPDAKKVGELGETSASEYADKLSAVSFTTVKGEKTSQPLIQEASATLECRLHEKHLTGTHELVIGKVVAAYATEDFSDYWDFTKYNPLLYAGTVNGKEKSWMFMSGRAEISRIPLKHQT